MGFFQACRRPGGIRRLAPPTFPSASPTSSAVAGHPRQDEEIFDFTDSRSSLPDGSISLFFSLRFVSPPEENRANYPYVKEGVGPVGSGAQSESGFMGTAGLGKPFTSFSYNPTLPTKPSPYSYSPLPSPATPATSPQSFVHLGQLPMSPHHVQVEKLHQDEPPFQDFAPRPATFTEFSINQPSPFQPHQPKPRGDGGPPENVVRHLPVPHAQYLPTFAREFSTAQEQARDHFAQVG